MNNRICQEDLESLINKAKVEEHLFHGGKSLILSYLLESGFTVNGVASVVDINNFDILMGRTIARNDAIEQLWMLEGYRLQNQLCENERT